MFSISLLPSKEQERATGSHSQNSQLYNDIENLRNTVLYLKAVDRVRSDPALHLLCIFFSPHSYTRVTLRRESPASLIKGCPDCNYNHVLVILSVLMHLCNNTSPLPRCISSCVIHLKPFPWQWEVTSRCRNLGWNSFQNTKRFTLANFSVKSRKIENYFKLWSMFSFYKYNRLFSPLHNCSSFLIAAKFCF